MSFGSFYTMTQENARDYCFCHIKQKRCFLHSTVIKVGKIRKVRYCPRKRQRDADSGANPVLLHWMNSFRTFEWLKESADPTTVIKQTRQLLALVKF